MLVTKVYLQVKDRPYYFKFNAEEAFNEAYYIATMAANVPHPELDVSEWYWIAKNDIGWNYAASLVLSMVYAILYLQEDRIDTFKYTIPQFETLKLGNAHFLPFKAMAEGETRRFRSDLALRPLPVDDLAKIPIFVVKKQDVDWYQITDQFSQESVRNLVSLFPTKEERTKMIALLEKIQARFEYEIAYISRVRQFVNLYELTQ